MADISGVIQTIGAVVASGVFTMLVTRSGNKSSQKNAEAENRAKTTTGVISGEAQFRQDQSVRITNLEKRIDDMSQRLEQQAAEAVRLREVERMRFEDSLSKERARFEAREDQLVRWGMWEAAPPPREAPIFVWPQHP